MIMIRVGLRAGLSAMVFIAVGCSGNNAIPTGPDSLSPLLIPRVEGVWGGPLTLTAVAGGAGPARTAGAVECAGAAFASVVGESNDTSLSITQTGTTLAARLTSAGTGLACAYTGRLGSSSFVLDAQACTAPPLILRCQPDAEGVVRVRQVQLVASSITANVNAPVDVTRISGQASHTYNIIDDGGTVSGLVATHRFDSLTRR